MSIVIYIYIVLKNSRVLALEKKIRASFQANNIYKIITPFLPYYTRSNYISYDCFKVRNLIDINKIFYIE